MSVSYQSLLGLTTVQADVLSVSDLTATNASITSSLTNFGSLTNQGAALFKSEIISEDQLSMLSVIDMGSNKIINLATPTLDNDAATKSYVDSVNATYTADEITLTKQTVGSDQQFSIKNTYSGQNSITIVGTIGDGIWEATPVAIAHGGTGATDASEARTNLGLAINSDVQAYNAGLQSIAGLTTAANEMIYLTGSNTYATTSITAFGRSLIDDSDSNAARTTLGLGSFSTQNVPPGSGILRTDGGVVSIDSASGFLVATNNLSDVANVATARDNLQLGTANQVEFNLIATNAGTSPSGTLHFYITNSGSLRAGFGLSGAETGSNAGSNLAFHNYSDGGLYLNTPLAINRASGVIDFGFAPTFTNPSGTRTNLGLGTMATQNSNNVNITGGTITGIGGVWTTSGSDIYYSAGKVGIGAAPSYQLDVQGDTRIGDSGASSYLINLGRSGVGAFRSAYIHGDGTNMYILNQQNGDVRINTNNSSNMLVVKPTGYVGIGTSSPNGNLEIQCAATTGFNHTIRSFVPSLLSSSFSGNAFVLGVGPSTKNSGYIAFRYDGGASSSNNFMSIGLWGADDIITAKGSAEVSVKGDLIYNASSTNPKYAIGSENTIGVKQVYGQVNMRTGASTGSGISSVLFPSAGKVKITFSPVFNYTPSLTATPVFYNFANLVIPLVSEIYYDYVLISTYNTAGVLISSDGGSNDVVLNIIAIGV
jgi:hypothetical protein